jgi:hypothetical protein
MKNAMIGESFSRELDQNADCLIRFNLEPLSNITELSEEQFGKLDLPSTITNAGITIDLT